MVTGVVIAGVDLAFEPSQELQKIIHPLIPFVIGLIIWLAVYVALRFDIRTPDDIKAEKKRQSDIQAQKDHEAKCDKKIKQCNEYLKMDLHPQEITRYKKIRSKYMQMKLRDISAEATKSAS